MEKSQIILLFWRTNFSQSSAESANERDDFSTDVTEEQTARRSSKFSVTALFREPGWLSLRGLGGACATTAPPLPVLPLAVTTSAVPRQAPYVPLSAVG